MKKFFIVLALLCVLPGLNTSAQQSATAPQKIRFAAEIEAFLKADQEKPPSQNLILFIGSSIFRHREKLTEQMAPLPVLIVP